MSTADHLPETVDALVVGGGFFGCQLATMLAPLCHRVAVVERESSLLQRASYHNQARVHQGYHYPRSVLTGLRSRVHFSRFVRDFQACIVNDFVKLYAVATNHSKVTSAQFVTFCQRIEAPLRPAPAELRRLFDEDLVEDVWVTQEYAFNAEILAQLVEQQLRQDDVAVGLGQTVRAVSVVDGDFLVELTDTSGRERRIRTQWLFNATYSALNVLLEAARRPPIPLKHELTELCLVDVPPILSKVGITVMCGPFFSIMPFPARALHSLSHVRYTPHGAWEERADLPYRRGRPLEPADFVRRSAFEAMRRDAARYVPLINTVVQQDSIWEIKTVLPQSEADDSRPILFRTDPELPRLVSVMGGKIDNVFDLPREVAQLFAQAQVASLPSERRPHVGL